MGFYSKFFPALVDVVNTLDLVIHEPLYDDKSFSDGLWDYVSYSIPHFLAHLDEAHQILQHRFPKRKRFSFIDVGCGIGTKVQLASHLFDAYGLELNKKYERMAKKIVKKRKFHNYGRHDDLNESKKIYREDALNFNAYHEYDVIYFFRPMNRDKLQKELENKVYSGAKPGAIIIPIFKIGELPRYIRKLKTPSNELHIKMLCGSKFKRLNQEIQAFL